MSLASRDPAQLSSQGLWNGGSNLIRVRALRFTKHFLIYSFEGYSLWVSLVLHGA